MFRSSQCPWMVCIHFVVPTLDSEVGRIKTMFQVGDCVFHQKNGRSGKVVGYGHQILDSAYLPTLIVRLIGDTGLNQKGQKRFVEDLSLAWMRLDG